MVGISWNRICLIKCTMKLSFTLLLFTIITSTVRAATDPLGEALYDLRIDGHSPCYVTDQKIYLYTTSLAHFDSTLTVHITYSLNEGWKVLRIDGDDVQSGDEYTFKEVNGKDNYNLSVVRTNGTTKTVSMKFTSLPIVQLTGSFDNNYKKGLITVQEPEKSQAQQFKIMAKLRGGNSNNIGKHKRNYHVKIIDENGEKLDHQLFGLRNDDSWILEAGQIDLSRIRNRVLTDLWNDYSVKPYYSDKEPKARSGTRGRFVELILNGKYNGIYCMTEAMDRKQMKLKKYDEQSKTIHGQLWKSKTWSYAVLMKQEPDDTDSHELLPLKDFDNYSDEWERFFVKYPDLDDVYPTDWQTLFDAVNFVCTSSDTDFKRHVAEYFDLPVIMDYYILMETTLATDNHGKNLYYAVYDKQEDKRITLGVWDLDGTLGQRWSLLYYHWDVAKPEQDYTAYINNNEHGESNLFRRLRKTDAENFNEKVRMRYRDLRNGPLNTEAILNRFRQQLAEFKTCGADQREYKKWSLDTDIERHALNFDTELAYIEDWLTRRMNYLDTVRFDIASLPTSGIKETGDMNRVRSQKSGIYNLSGQLVSKDYNEQVLHALPSGIYIVNGKKIVVGN